MKLAKTLIPLFVLLLLIGQAVTLEAATSVPWTSQTYTAYASIDYLGWLKDSDVQTGSTPPVSAQASVYHSGLGSIWAESVISSTSMSAWTTDQNYAYASASFDGIFAASPSQFDFSYSGYTWGSSWLSIEDLDLGLTIYSGSIFSQPFGPPDGVISVPVTTGNNIRVNFGIGSDYASSLTYSMSLSPYTPPAAPEPISSILFVTGGTLLAGRRFIRRKA